MPILLEMCNLPFLVFIEFAWPKHFKVHSYLRFIGHELLRELFSTQNHEKLVYNPLLNFPVHAKVD